MTDIIQIVQLLLIFVILIVLIFQIRAIGKKVALMEVRLSNMDRNVAYIDRTITAIVNRDAPGARSGVATERPTTIAR